MKTILSVLAVSLLATIAPAETDAPEAAATLPEAANQAALDNRLADFKALDEQIETRIAGVVEALSRMEDSRTSGRQVIEMKRNALKALGEAIGYYHERINRLSNDLKQIQLPEARERIAQQLGYFYRRMEQRIADVVAITASLSRHTGGADYLEQNREARAAGAVTAQGGAERDRARNAELLQSRAQEIIDTVVEKLKQDAATLKLRADDLSARMAATEDDQLLAIVNRHVADLTESVDTRIAQVREAQTPNAEAGRELLNREALDAREDLQNFGAILRKEFEELDALRLEINRRLMQSWTGEVP